MYPKHGWGYEMDKRLEEMRHDPAEYVESVRRRLRRARRRLNITIAAVIALVVLTALMAVV